MDYLFEQKFEIEVFGNALLIWNKFLPMPDYIPLDRPYTLWERFNKLNIIRRIKMGTDNKTEKLKCCDENDDLLATYCRLFNITLEPKRIEMPFPIKIIKQWPATIVFWRDGTKTVVYAF